MTTTPPPADLQRRIEEFARNPSSSAFVPLARACRRQGSLDLAMSICRDGLERNPRHVEGRALLASLYLEDGDHAGAAGEWSKVLRLEPGNFEALRGLGFGYIEQGDIPNAKQHLERAALIRPTDAAVQEALRLLQTRIADSAVDPAEPLEAEKRKDAANRSSEEAHASTHAQLLPAERAQVTSDSVSNATADADEDAPVLDPADVYAVHAFEFGEGAVGGLPVAEPRASHGDGAARRLFDSLLGGADMAFLLLIFVLLTTMFAAAATAIHLAVSALGSVPGLTAASDSSTVLSPEMTAADEEGTREAFEAIESPDQIEIPPPPPPERIARPATPVLSDAVIDEEIIIASTTFEDDPIEMMRAPPTSTSDDVSAAPTFTPTAVRPALQNRADVRRALTRNYPPELRKAGIGGRATVSFFIDEEGRVLDTQLNESSGYDELDRAALKVAEVMRFSPAVNRDRKEQVWISIPIVFDPRQ